MYSMRYKENYYFSSISETNNDTSEDGIPGNPVGQLQELTMCRHWPPPRYDLVQEIGQPHEREFIMLCKVLKWTELGDYAFSRCIYTHVYIIFLIFLIFDFFIFYFFILSFFFLNILCANFCYKFSKVYSWNSSINLMFTIFQHMYTQLTKGGNTTKKCKETVFLYVLWWWKACD